MFHLRLLAAGRRSRGEGREAVLDRGKLLKERAGKPAAEIGHGVLDPRPDLPLRNVDELLAFPGERDDLSPLVVRPRPNLDQAELGELRNGPRCARLGDADGLGEFADGERPEPVERAEEGVLARLKRHVLLVHDALRIGLQALADALQAAPERQEAEFANDVFDHDRTRAEASIIHKLYNCACNIVQRHACRRRRLRRRLCR